MSSPSPHQPNKLTCTLNADGNQDCILDLVEVSSVVPEDLKPYLEQRKRERREARDRAARPLPPGAPAADARPTE